MEHAIRADSETTAARAGAAEAGPRLRTWHLYVALVVLSAALAWVNKEYVMTRDTYHALLGDQLDSQRIDQHFDLVRQSARWGYLALPLFVWLRIALVAFLAQLFFLLFLVEIPIRRVFRAVCWAFPALLYGMAVRLFVLVRLGPGEVTRADLSRMPGSAADLFLDPSRHDTALYTLLSMVNAWELLWCGVLYFALRRVGDAGRLATASVVAMVWGLIAVFQWGITLYLMGMQ